MRAEDIFDICHNRVKQCRLQLLSAGSSFPDGMPHGGGLAIVGNRAAEYLGDFALAGRRCLFPWPQRLELFRRYYVRGESSKRVQEQLQVPKVTFDFWCREIKKSVAPELVRRELFPPRLYRQRSPEDESQYTTSLWADVMEAR